MSFSREGEAVEELLKPYDYPKMTGPYAEL